MHVYMFDYVCMTMHVNMYVYMTKYVYMYVYKTVISIQNNSEINSI